MALPLLVFSAALTSVILWYYRQPLSRSFFRPDMITARVYRLCHANMTVTAELARDPSQVPSKVFHDLYEGHDSENPGSELKVVTDEEDALRRAAECGNWGVSQPSELFLKVNIEPGASVAGLQCLTVFPI